MSEDNKYTYVNPYLKNEDDKKEPEYKLTFKNGIESDVVYVHNSNFKVESHRDRPMVRVSLLGGPGFIIRKVAGKNALNGSEITFDTLSFKEVMGKSKIKEAQVFVFDVKKATSWDKYYRYFRRHPKDDIRLAYNMFLLGLFVGGLSIGLGVCGLF